MTARLPFSSSPSLGQRKALYRQRIPEFSCVREKTVDIDILVTSRNGDRKIKQSIIITSRPPSRKRKWNQLSQFRRTSTKVIPIEKTESQTFTFQNKKLLRPFFFKIFKFLSKLFGHVGFNRKIISNFIVSVLV